MNSNTYSIIVIGEVLVDIFPDHESVGGAPFNFAFHLSAFNYNVKFFSRIGQDSAGVKIQRFISKHNISAGNIQIDSVHPTGRVIVTLDDKGMPDFDIIENSAYDFIDYTEDIEESLKNAKMIYIGTLVQRNKHSFNTIKRILKGKRSDTYVFYDVNLRQNCFDKNIIDNSLKYADIVKLNDEELTILKSLYKETCSDNHFIKTLCYKHNIKWLSLTRGENGSALFHRDRVLEMSPEAASLKIADTVGAGDAYSAILAIGILSKWPMKKIIEKAAEFSGAVCEINGAVPEDKQFYRRVNLQD